MVICSEEQTKTIKDLFYEISQCKGWGNGRDIASIVKDCIRLQSLQEINERMFEFASYILKIDAFKDTLLPSSMYGFITTTAGILFNGYIGNMVDRWNRLNFVVSSNFAQKVTIFLSCVCLLMMDSYYMLALVILFSSISRLASVANTIAIEKDWVALSKSAN